VSFNIVHQSNGNSSHSVPCRPGTSSIKEAGQCKACPLGSFQDEFGKAGCKHCPKDFSTRAQASVSMDDCYCTTSICINNSRLEYSFVCTDVGPPTTTPYSHTRTPFTNEQKRWIVLTPLGIIPILTIRF
jgi:hypothetical protein